MNGLMHIDGVLLPRGIEEAKQEIRVCNTFTERYGLRLNEQEIGELVQSRITALRRAGRVEFGGGILPKLIHAFCDSPFLEQESYAETLEELQEAFYCCKTDSGDRYTDDELLELMVTVFNGRAHGSAEYLIGTTLNELARYARNSYDPTDVEDAGDLF